MLIHVDNAFSDKESAKYRIVVNAQKEQMCSECHLYLFLSFFTEKSRHSLSLRSVTFTGKKNNTNLHI